MKLYISGSPFSVTVHSCIDYAKLFSGVRAPSDVFCNPWGCAYDSRGNIIIANSGQHNILVFNSQGILQFKFGIPGKQVGQFNHPSAVAVDSKDQIIVADTHNHRVQVFDSQGNFRLRFGGFGSANGQFNFVFGLAVDSQDNVIVADYGNRRVQFFDHTGRCVGLFGVDSNPRSVAVDLKQSINRSVTLEIILLRYHYSRARYSSL